MAKRRNDRCDSNFTLWYIHNLVHVANLQSDVPRPGHRHVLRALSVVVRSVVPTVLEVFSVQALGTNLDLQINLDHELTFFVSLRG